MICTFPLKVHLVKFAMSTDDVTTSTVVKVSN